MPVPNIDKERLAKEKLIDEMKEVFENIDKFGTKVSKIKDDIKDMIILAKKENVSSSDAESSFKDVDSELKEVTKSYRRAQGILQERNLSLKGDPFEKLYKEIKELGSGAMHSVRLSTEMYESAKTALIEATVNAAKKDSHTAARYSARATRMFNMSKNAQTARIPGSLLDDRCNAHFGSVERRYEALDDLRKDYRECIDKLKKPTELENALLHLKKMKQLSEKISNGVEPLEGFAIWCIACNLQAETLRSAKAYENDAKNCEKISKSALDFAKNANNDDDDAQRAKKVADISKICESVEISVGKIEYNIGEIGQDVRSDKLNETIDWDKDDKDKINSILLNHRDQNLAEISKLHKDIKKLAEKAVSISGMPNGPGPIRTYSVT